MSVIKVDAASHVTDVFVDGPHSIDLAVMCAGT